MPDAELGTCTARAESIKNAVSLVRGSLDTYSGGYTQSLPFDMEGTHGVAWLELAGQARASEGSPPRQIKSKVVLGCVSLDYDNCV